MATSFPHACDFTSSEVSRQIDQGLQQNQPLLTPYLDVLIPSCDFDPVLRKPRSSFVCDLNVLKKLHKSQDASWRNLLLSQPPVKGVSIHVHIESSRLEGPIWALRVGAPGWDVRWMSYARTPGVSAETNPPEGGMQRQELYMHKIFRVENRAGVRMDAALSKVYAVAVNVIGGLEARTWMVEVELY